MQIHTVTTKEEARLKLTQALNSSLKKGHDDNRSFLLLVSGGSAFDLFSDIDVNSFDNRATVGVLDERYSTDPTINNMAQFVQTTFYTSLKVKDVHFIDTRVQDGETGEEHAKRFDQALSDWKKNNPDGLIFAIVGIGPDGHTSGILPFPENPSLFSKFFENPNALVVHYDADGKNPYRYRSTTTNIFLRNSIDHSFVYAVGANKKDALTRLAAKEGSLAETPARILREMKSVELFTDVSLE